MKVLGQFKKFFGVSSVLYTCLSFAIILLYKKGNPVKWEWYQMDVGNLFFDILVFAAIAGAVITLVDLIPKLPAVVKSLIKLVLIYADFYFWMLRGNGNASHIMIMSTIYVAVFFAITGIGALLGLIGKKKKNDEYDSVYGEDK